MDTIENNAPLSLQNVSFSYHQAPLLMNQLSCTFSPGEVTAIIGPNGCGKSTLLYLLSGLLTPQKGVACLGNMPVSAIPSRKRARHIAIVHQQNDAPGEYSVETLVALGRLPHHRRFGGALSENDHRAIDESISLMGIESIRQSPVSRLSGGQLQRVWLAMAFAQETEVLLLDEITTYLDIHYQLEILELLNHLPREKRKTTVMVMHDINQALRYSQHIFLMQKGRILSNAPSSSGLDHTLLQSVFQIDAVPFFREGIPQYYFYPKENPHV